jgi:hypothetical protein
MKNQVAVRTAATGLDMIDKLQILKVWQEHQFYFHVGRA